MKRTNMWAAVLLFASALAYLVGLRGPQALRANSVVLSTGAINIYGSYAVIRVIYAPQDKRVGKKPVGYFDTEGKSITMPRTLLEPPREEPETERPAAKK